MDFSHNFADSLYLKGSIFFLLSVLETQSYLARGDLFHACNFFFHFNKILSKVYFVLS